MQCLDAIDREIMVDQARPAREAVYTNRECPILQDMDGEVSKLLARLKSRTVEETVSNLLNEVDISVIRQTRLELYKSAKQLYAEISEEETTGWRLISRRGSKSRSHQCLDIVRLFQYSSALSLDFPSDIIRVESQEKLSHIDTHADTHVEKPNAKPHAETDVDVDTHADTHVEKPNVKPHAEKDVDATVNTHADTLVEKPNHLDSLNELERVVAELLEREIDYDRTILDMRELISDMHGTIEKLTARVEVCEGHENLENEVTPRAHHSFSSAASLVFSSPPSLHNLLNTQVEKPNAITHAGTHLDTQVEKPNVGVNNELDFYDTDTVPLDDGIMEYASIHPWQYERYISRDIPRGAANAITSETATESSIRDCGDPPAPDVGGSLQSRMDELCERLYLAEATIILTSETVDSLPDVNDHCHIKSRVKDVELDINKCKKRLCRAEVKIDNNEKDIHEHWIQHGRADTRRAQSPVIPTSNRFSPLLVLDDIASADTTDARDTRHEDENYRTAVDSQPRTDDLHAQSRDDETWSRARKPKVKSKPKVKPQKQNETKLSIIGSSLARDLGEYVYSSCSSSDNMRVCSYPNPGSDAETISKRLHNFISEKDDVVFIMAGTNNVPRDSTERCIREIGSVIEEAQRLRPEAPIIISELPPRYDISQHRKIREINKFISDTCARSSNLYLIDNAYERADFDKKGLHFSAAGKLKLARSIRNAVRPFQQ